MQFYATDHQSNTAALLKKRGRKTTAEYDVCKLEPLECTGAGPHVQSCH